jgi:nucleoside-diphosphate-sugar epimerase
MTVLVTGATGYVGKEFVRAYCNTYDIVVLARGASDTKDLEPLRCVVRKYKSFADIDNIFLEFDISGVVHFASSVIVEHKPKDIDGLIESNIKFGTLLLEACKKNTTRWFINTGTLWQNYKNNDYNPVNLYAATKEAFEKIAKYYTETSSLVFTTIKLCDTFGPNDSRDKIFNLWDKHSKSGEVLAMSKGEQIVDILYIEDVVAGFGAMIEHLKKNNYTEFNNKCYVITSRQRMTLKELSELFQKMTNRKLNINWGDRPYRSREVMVPYEKGEILPEWRQKYSLEEAIIKAIG